MEYQMTGWFHKCRHSSKRTPDIDWHDYFMAIAFLSAKRSKNPTVQVGACIVNNDNRIVGIGYNGMPNGCKDSQFPWNDLPRTDINSKYLYVCHAEMNAVMNKYSNDIKGCTIYASLFPCNECAKIIIQSGIKNVIYVYNKYPERVEMIAAKRMFDAAGVIYRQYIPKNKKIEINFIETDWTN